LLTLPPEVIPNPPATRTFPFGSNVAVAIVRAVDILAASNQVFATGSYNRSEDCA
jgi:hypothetical protein